MKRSLLTASLALAAAFGLGSCVERPEGVLSDRSMAPVVAEMEVAEAYLRSNPLPEGMTRADSREAILAYVLDKHGMSRADYDSTMAWYSRNPDVYYEFCDEVEKVLVRERRKQGGKSAPEMEGSDLWPYSRMMVVSALNSTDGPLFSIPAPDMQAGESLKLRMRFNNLTDANAMLGVRYDDGTSAYVTGTPTGKKLEISLQTDTSKMVTGIFGNVRLAEPPRRPLWIDSISLTAAPFDSLNYHTIHSARIFRQ